MAGRRSALGRGLDALIPGAAPNERGAAGERSSEAAEREAAPAQEGRPAEIPVNAIDPNPEQPRRVFDPEQLASLVDSVRRHGVLQPVVVRRNGDRFELIVGERRWRASRAAGRETIPAVVADVDSKDRLELAIVENVQRHDLNPIELAHAYRALLESGATQEEVGQRVGKDRSSVANHLRLLELSKDLQEDVEMGRVSMGHAKALLQISNPERRRHLRNRVLSEGLSVREAERIGREIAGPSPRAPARRKSTASQTLDPDLQELVNALQARLQTRVRVNGDGSRGRIEIEYFEAGDLRRIADLMLETAR